MTNPLCFLAEGAYRRETMKATNISDGKIIGIGSVTILPGEIMEIPDDMINNPTLAIYEDLKFITISGKPTVVDTKDKPEPKKKAKEDAEAAEMLRKTRLASLNGISEENLAKLAGELGINPAECKNVTDMLGKVKAALEK